MTVADLIASLRVDDHGRKIPAAAKVLIATEPNDAWEILSIYTSEDGKTCWIDMAPKRVSR